MHPEAYSEMARLLFRYLGDAPNVLDVGSLDVNGTYRPLVEGRGWAYTGLDLVAGKNVDVVAAEPYRYPFVDSSFDIVISGSTAEHVAMPWLWIPELARLLRPGGMLAVITHHRFALHRYPQDYWRFMPDGLELLFNLAGGLGRYDIRMFNEHDIYGVAWRVA